MPLSADDIIAGLTILVLLLLSVVLYNILFVARDLRSTMRRVSDVTEKVEEVIIKPISMADTVVEYVTAWAEDMQKQQGKKKVVKTTKRKLKQ